MEILKEKNEKVCKMEVEFTPEEKKMLLKHFKSSCNKEKLEELKLEWAFVDLLTKFVNEYNEKELVNEG